MWHGSHIKQILLNVILRLKKKKKQFKWHTNIFKNIFSIPFLHVYYCKKVLYSVRWHKKSYLYEYKNESLKRINRHQGWHKHRTIYYFGSKDDSSRKNSLRFKNDILCVNLVQIWLHLKKVVIDYLRKKNLTLFFSHWNTINYITNHLKSLPGFTNLFLVHSGCILFLWKDI